MFTTIGRFGTIVDCREHATGIQFTLRNTDKTHELKSTNKLNCGGVDISFKELPDIIAHPDSMLRIPDDVPAERRPASDVAPPSILDYLNDDCLSEIFDKRALDVDDLCSVARASDRCNVAAQRAIRSRYRKQLSLQCTWPFGRYAALLRLSGEQITSIDIGFTGGLTNAYADIALGLIAYHCRNVEHLKCASLMPISLAIARFERRRANGIDEPQPFGTLKSLKSIDYYGPTIRVIPYMRLPNLTDLNMGMQYVGGAETAQFFASHQHIKRLTLNFSRLSAHVKEILCSLSDLEELHMSGELNISNSDYSCFGQLKRLKVLTCSEMIQKNVYLILKEIRDGRVQLERLTIAGQTLPVIAGSIGSLKYIDCDFGNNRDGSRLLDIPTLVAVAASPSLEEIRISSRSRVTFDFIRDFVANVPDKVKAARFHTDCWGIDAWRTPFYTFEAIDMVLENRTLATINHMVNTSAISLHVMLFVIKRNKEAAGKKLHRFRDWLTIVARDTPLPF